MKMLRALAVAILFGIGIGPMGCGHALAQFRAGTLQPARLGSVYMLRGIFGLSAGLDQVAAELAGLGIKTAVHQHTEWPSIAEAIKARYTAGLRYEPIIIIGYSLGANDAVQLSRALGTAGIPVDLLITLDPTIPAPVPANVARAVDLYQRRAGAMGVPLAAGPGFQGALIIRNMSYLPGIGHDNLAQHPEVRREIVAHVLQVARQRSARPH